MAPAVHLAEANDADLALAAKRGDMQAFDELVRRHQEMVSRIAFRFAPDRADMEDLGQEAFVRAYRSLHRWEPTAPFEHWLRKITYNVGRDHFRKRKRSWWGFLRSNDPADVENEAAPEAGDDPRSPHGSVEEVQRILAGLPADDRTVLTLQFLEELPLKEVAAIMGWTLDKTKARSSRARKRLRTTLKEHGYRE